MIDNKQNVFIHCHIRVNSTLAFGLGSIRGAKNLNVEPTDGQPCSLYPNPLNLLTSRLCVPRYRLARKNDAGHLGFFCSIGTKGVYYHALRSQRSICLCRPGIRTKGVYRHTLRACQACNSLGSLAPSKVPQSHRIYATGLQGRETIKAVTIGGLANPVIKITSVPKGFLVSEKLGSHRTLYHMVWSEITYAPHEAKLPVSHTNECKIAEADGLGSLPGGGHLCQGCSNDEAPPLALIGKENVLNPQRSSNHSQGQKEEEEILHQNMLNHAELLNYEDTDTTKTRQESGLSCNLRSPSTCDLFPSDSFKLFRVPQPPDNALEERPSVRALGFCLIDLFIGERDQGPYLRDFQSPLNSSIYENIRQLGAPDYVSVEKVRNTNKQERLQRPVFFTVGNTQNYSSKKKSDSFLLLGCLIQS
ncbi:hypothetical protein U0070_001977 [Myodes glareolus]|uniref:Uncharacterized protein n=1 Tax=Myodes glareolus TaxID=447135 RepID=A0AAW0J8J4_MYOGA